MSDSSPTIHPFFQPRKIKTETPQSSPSPRKKVKQTTLPDCKLLEEIALSSSHTEETTASEKSNPGSRKTTKRKSKENEKTDLDESQNIDENKPKSKRGRKPKKVENKKASVPSIDQSPEKSFPAQASASPTLLSNEPLAEVSSLKSPDSATGSTELIDPDHESEAFATKPEDKQLEQTKKPESKKHFVFTKKQKPVYPKLLSEEPLKAESSCATLRPLQQKIDLICEEFNFYGRVKPKAKKTRHDNEFSRLDRSIYQHGHWPIRVEKNTLPLTPIKKLENKQLLKNAIQAYTPFASIPQTKKIRPKCDKKTPLLDKKVVHSWLDDNFPGWDEFSSCVRMLRRATGPKTEDTSQQRWIEKYRPKTVDGLLGSKHNHVYLRNWLHKMKIEPAIGQDTSPKPARKSTTDEESNVFRKMMAQQTKMDQDDDDFVDTSITARKASKQKSQQQHKPASSNMILIVGDYGVGKTALVYTAAEQEKYEIFEMNSGSRRSGKDIISTLGEMTKSHLVAFNNKKTEPKTIPEEMKKKKMKLNPILSSQGTNSFSSERKAEKLSCFIRKKTETDENKTSIDKKNGPKQSLILLEEVDLLFEEDKGFWPALVELSQTSRRPIIMTCNDPDQIPFEILCLQTVLYIKPPELEEVLPYLWLVCYAEGYAVDPKDLVCLVSMIGCDLRHLLQTLELYRGVLNPFENVSGLYPHMSLYEKQAAYVPFKSTIDNYQITDAYRSALYGRFEKIEENECLEDLEKQLDSEAFIDSWLETKENNQTLHTSTKDAIVGYTSIVTENYEDSISSDIFTYATALCQPKKSIALEWENLKSAREYAYQEEKEAIEKILPLKLIYQSSPETVMMEYIPYIRLMLDNSAASILNNRARKTRSNRKRIHLPLSEESVNILMTPRELRDETAEIIERIMEIEL